MSISDLTLIRHFITQKEPQHDLKDESRNVYDRRCKKNSGNGYI